MAEESVDTKFQRIQKIGSAITENGRFAFVAASLEKPDGSFNVECGLVLPESNGIETIAALCQLRAGLDTMMAAVAKTMEMPPEIMEALVRDGAHVVQEKSKKGTLQVVVDKEAYERAVKGEPLVKE